MRRSATSFDWPIYLVGAPARSCAPPVCPARVLHPLVCLPVCVSIGLSLACSTGGAFAGLPPSLAASPIAAPTPALAVAPAPAPAARAPAATAAGPGRGGGRPGRNAAAKPAADKPTAVKAELEMPEFDESTDVVDEVNSFCASVSKELGKGSEMAMRLAFGPFRVRHPFACTMHLRVHSQLTPTCPAFVCVCMSPLVARS